MITVCKPGTIYQARGHGAYLYVLERGLVEVNGISIPTLGAAKITDEKNVTNRGKRRYRAATGRCKCKQITANISSGLLSDI